MSTNNLRKRQKKIFFKYYKTSWARKLADPTLIRLQVYQVIKGEFKPAKHLDLPQFQMRKIISKIRCSDHPLEIERGRHLNIPRVERICETCTEGVIEDEEHFLLKCKIYQPLREKHHMNTDNIHNFFNTQNQDNLAKYLTSAFKLREITKDKI